jgi:Ankyrin repeat
MKNILWLTLLVAFEIQCMEQSQNTDMQADRKEIMALMMATAVPMHERVFRLIETLDTLKVTNAQIDALMAIVVRADYRPLLKYAFDKKKILPTDELASSMLVEAASHEISNLTILLDCGVDVNKPGKLLVERNNDIQTYTPLIIAIKNACCTHVKNLLEKGADANKCEPHENLPYIEAFLRFHKYKRKFNMPCIKNPRADKDFYFSAIMYLLIEAGADKHKENGKDILVQHYNSRGNTFVSRNVQDMINRLGYSGI